MNDEKEVLELANYIRTLVPPGVTNGLAVKAFALLLAEAVYQMDKDGGIVFASAEGLLKARFGMLKTGLLKIQEEE